MVRTADLDLLLRRQVEVLRAALDALSAAGFAFEAGAEPFVDAADESVLQRIVSSGANIAAASGAATIDLMLSLAGTSFEDLAVDADRPSP